jgi:hypothetical protein
MKKTILMLAMASMLFSCSEDQKEVETNKDSEGMHITVHDDSTKADVNINSNNIHVKTDDGKEADVKIDANGSMDIKTSEGDATVKMDKNGNMNIKTKEGDASVSMDKNGNMQIKGPDGKEINVNVKDGK